MVHRGHLIGTHVSTDGLGATNVPGVWAAVNADLVTEDTRLAVEARRAAGANAQAASGNAQASASIA